MSSEEITAAAGGHLEARRPHRHSRVLRVTGRRAEKLIRHLGLSNVRQDHLDEAEAIAPVVCIQNPYGLDYKREEDEIVRTCEQRGIAYVPFFAIAGAQREAGATSGHSEAVHAVARAHGVTPHQVRLAWTLHQGPHVLAIPGTGDPKHLVDNVAAGALRFTADELASLS